MTKSVYHKYRMTDKAEMVYKILNKYKHGTTANKIAKLMRCNNCTASKYLNWFLYHGTIDMFKIGKYKVFKVKEENKNKNIRVMIDNAMEKERTK